MSQEYDPTTLRFERIEAALETAKREIVEELTEVMRSMQTELLRGFAAFAEGQAARMKKLETNHAALDESATVRLRTLEERMIQIELRLNLQ